MHPSSNVSFVHTLPHARSFHAGLFFLSVSVCALVACFGSPRADASGIFGTLSNFDVYNPTPEPSEGFEIELEDIHSSDLRGTFPSHYNIKNVTDYSDGTTFGVRVKFEDYSFLDSSSVLHTAVNANPSPQNTNGHFCVNLADCEHFGFSLAAQPTASRYYWLNKLADGSYERINTTPLAVPTPSWTYFPPAAPGDAAMVRAEIRVPEPAEVVPQRPDSIWVKTFKTELEREVDLDELMSGPGGIVPQDAGEVETEWELLEGGKMKGKNVQVGANGKAVLRRYEFFKYTGPYDAAHEPTSLFLEDDTLDPVALGEVGNFIAANMVAANLVVPEPSTWILLLSGIAMLGLTKCRRGSDASRRE